MKIATLLGIAAVISSITGLVALFVHTRNHAKKTP